MAKWLGVEPSIPKVASSNPSSDDTFLHHKGKMKLFAFVVFFENFHKNTYIGVKSDEESESDLEKKPILDQTWTKIQTMCHYSTLGNVLFDPTFSLQNAKFLYIDCFLA